MAQIACNLTQTKRNERLKITKIHAGYRVHHNLAELGIHEEELIKTVKNDVGPIIIEVKGTKIALGRGIAQKILVERVLND